MLLQSELVKQRLAIETSFQEKLAARLDQDRDGWQDELRRERDGRAQLQSEYNRLSSHVDDLTRRLRDAEGDAAAAKEEANELRRALARMRQEFEAERALMVRELKSVRCTNLMIMN